MSAFTPAGQLLKAGTCIDSARVPRIKNCPGTYQRFPIQIEKCVSVECTNEQHFDFFFGGVHT